MTHGSDPSKGLEQRVRELQTRLHDSETQLAELAAERARLAQQEADERLLIESMRDVILVLDADGRYLMVPPTAPDLLYNAPGDILGRRMHDVLPKELADRFLATVGEALAAGMARHVEYTLPVADRHVHFSAVVSPMGADRVVWVARDVTMQRETERALRASEERYRLLFEANPSPMWVYDRATLRFLAVNQAAMAQYGYTREEFLDMTIADIRPPEEIGELMRAVEESPPGLHYSGSWRHRRRDGSIVNVEIAAHPIEFDGHQAELVLAHDVTLRERADAERREAVDVMRAVIDDSPFAIVSVGLDGLITRWNPAAESLFGWTAEEMLGHSLSVLFPGGREDDYERMRAAVTAGAPTLGYETQRVRKDGTVVDVSASFAALHDAAGHINGFMAIVADVTEQKRLQQRLRQSQKMEAVGQLAGGIAHDFNNLLTAITSYSQLLLEETATDDPRHADIDEIRRAAERAARLTRQLLTFTRQQVVQPQVMSLNTVVNDMYRMLRRLVREDIEIRLALDPDLGMVEADPGQIEQVLLNLVVNASDAMPGGGRLLIETKPIELGSPWADPDEPGLAPGPYCMLAVSDTGVGMTAEVRQRVFEPFFTTKPPGKGTGLGLATAYGIVQQARGQIGVYSEPGHGTSVKVFLPRVAASAEPAKAAPSTGRASLNGRETILLVEDNDSVRRVAQRVLTRQGYSVVEALSGAEGFAILEQRSADIDLIVTDVIMPGMSGSQLAEKVRERWPQARVLFMSGYTKDAANQFGELGDGTAYLEKPFEPARLLQKVRALLDGRAAPLR